MDRDLLDRGVVRAGEERSFSPEEEAAFVANGVADPVVVKPKKEVID
jgi:hypothetical protein